MQKKTKFKNQINQQATRQMTKKKQHQTCMYENKTTTTVNKYKEKTKTARTQTKMHDNRKSRQNGNSDQLENLNLRSKKT